MKSKARVLGCNAVIEVKDPVLGFNIKVGEIDNFSVSATSSLIKSRPIGSAIETIQYKYGGYELSFSGGKVDWELANLLHAQDLLARSIGECPVFNVVSTITHFDGTKETYLYNNVIIHGYEESMQSDSQITESFKGYSPQKQQIGLEQIGTAIYGIISSVVQEAITEGINKIGSEFGVF